VVEASPACSNLHGLQPGAIHALTTLLVGKLQDNPPTHRLTELRQLAALILNGLSAVVRLTPGYSATLFVSGSFNLLSNLMPCHKSTVKWDAKNAL